MHLSGSINQILLTDEMTPGERKAKHKLSGRYYHWRIKKELNFLNIKQYRKSSATHEKDNRGENKHS